MRERRHTGESDLLSTATAHREICRLKWQGKAGWTALLLVSHWIRWDSWRLGGMIPRLDLWRILVFHSWVQESATYLGRLVLGKYLYEHRGLGRSES